MARILTLSLCFSSSTPGSFDPDVGVVAVAWLRLRDELPDSSWDGLAGGDEDGPCDALLSIGRVRGAVAPW